MKKYLGLDIGGTKIEIILLIETIDKTAHKVVSNFYKIQDRKRIDTNRDKGYDFVLNNILNLCLDICSTNNLKIGDIEAIGLGLPGSINPDTLIMVNGNSLVFKDKNVKNDLQNLLKTKVPIFIENDANLFALSETIWGAGRDHCKVNKTESNNLLGIGIILGTGCGGGFVNKGKIYNGRRGGGLEIGHTTLVEQGTPCYCGRVGCAEQYLSGSGITNEYLKNFKMKLSAQEIFNNYKDSDQKSTQVINQYKSNLINFLSNLNNIFDPDFIVLGGGVSNQDIIYKGLTLEVRKRSFITNSNIEIYKNKLGDSSGVLGAAILPLL